MAQRWRVYHPNINKNILQWSELCAMLLVHSLFHLSNLFRTLIHPQRPGKRRSSPAFRSSVKDPQSVKSSPHFSRLTCHISRLACSPTSWSFARRGLRDDGKVGASRTDGRRCMSARQNLKKWLMDSRATKTSCTKRAKFKSFFVPLEETRSRFWSPVTLLNFIYFTNGFQHYFTHTEAILVIKNLSFSIRCNFARRGTLRLLTFVWLGALPFFALS